MKLEKSFTLSVVVTPPIGFGEGPIRSLTFIGAASGRVTGELLNAEILPGRGGDWLTAGSDGYARPDIRHTLQTDDGAYIYIQGSGFMEFNQATTAAVSSGTPTDFADHYIRTAFTLETGDARYSWVNHALFVGEGRFRTGSVIEYVIYRVA